VIGASAGGHSAVKEVLREVSQDIPAALIIMQHTSAPSFDAKKFRLKDWLQQATRIPVVQISDGERLRMGVVYVVLSWMAPECCAV
jgi:two-component system, chemotaxis family, protein-glutamate methylesterase/glutaminase